MSQVPPLQPTPPQKDSGAAIATAAAGGGIIVIVLAVVGVMVVMGLCVIGILIALLLPAINAARDAARRVESMNNVKQISLAMHNYETVNGQFPPQFTVDEEGNPLHSWRTLILPYLEQEVIFSQIKQDEPWNSSDNSFYSNVGLMVYVSPRYGDRGTNNLTNYVAIAGEGFLFHGGQGTKMHDVADGLSNTMLVIEIANSDIAWAEPRDLSLDEVQFEEAGAPEDTPNLIRRAAIIGFADGHVTASEITDREELRKLLTISGGEPVAAW